VVIPWVQTNVACRPVKLGRSKREDPLVVDVSVEVLNFARLEKSLSTHLIRLPAHSKTAFAAARLMTVLGPVQAEMRASVRGQKVQATPIPCSKTALAATEL